MPGGCVRIAAADTESGPLLIVWWVPDASLQAQAESLEHTIASTVLVNSEGRALRRPLRAGP